MSEKIGRRDLLKIAGGTIAASLLPSCQPEVESGRYESAARFRYCLNTSTIRGQGLTLPEEIEIAAKAGFDAVEPWIREIRTYTEAGGSLAELRQKISDLGLTIESGIGFAQWIVDDETERAKGLEEAKLDMEMLSSIGGKRMAAPPAGAVRGPQLDLLKAAERYRTLIEMGEAFGIIPQVEVWGFSDNLKRLGQAALVAIESGHPNACILPDIFHIYKGGSDFASLKMFGTKAIQVFHMNDYPASPSREEIADKDRVYPGDGAANLNSILSDLHVVNPDLVLSLELFNESYWQKDAMEVAQTGLSRLKKAVEAAVPKERTVLQSSREG